MSEMFPPTLDDQIAELKRELSMRATAYPRFIAAKKLTHEAAARQTARMKAALSTLMGLQQSESPRG